MPYKVVSYRPGVGYGRDLDHSVNTFQETLDAARELRAKSPAGHLVYIYDPDGTPLFRWSHNAGQGWVLLEGPALVPPLARS
jgi:hypothetical protein